MTARALGRYCIDVPNGWTCKQTSQGFGCVLALFAMGTGLLLSSYYWDGMKLRFGWLSTFGSILLLLSAIAPVRYAYGWVRSGEWTGGAPRLVKDIAGRPYVVSGPQGEWMHLTDDLLRSFERPMDRHEMEQAFHRRYSDHVVRQGWMPVAGGNAHWGVYRMGSQLLKKYTFYLNIPARSDVANDNAVSDHDDTERQLEIIATAKLRTPDADRTEEIYDTIFRSITPEYD